MCIRFGGVSITYTYCVGCEHENTIRKELILQYAYSSRLIRYIKRFGKIKLNNMIVDINQVIQEDDLVNIEMPFEEIDVIPAKGKLDIIYEDDEILILNKPPYCVTHPSKKNQTDTLANFISHYWLATGVHAKIRFIMRLDRDTTGLIAIAKNKYVHHFVQEQMQAQVAEKKYLAYVYGNLQEKAGLIDKPIGLKEDEKIRRSVFQNGQKAVTHYQVIQEFKGASLIELKLETGRTHQIRVHLHHIGHPILGDPLYFSDDSQALSKLLAINHQTLHASELELSLPQNGKMFFKAKVQNNMIELGSKLMKLSGKRGKE